MAYNHKLPVNVSVEGQICVPLFLPADKDYIALFLGQIRKLANDRHYERDENKTALIVRRKWLDVTINPLIDALINGDDCGMNEIDCEAIEACLQDSETIAEIDARIAELEANMATKEEICEAIQCALEDAAKRYLMAQTSNLNYGIEILPDDGKSLSLIDGGKPITSDDVDADNLELRNGQCFAVGAGLAGFINTINSFVIEGFTANQIAELLAYSYLMLFNQNDANFVQAIQDYIDFASDVVTPLVNPEDVSKFVWMEGATILALLKYAIAVQNSAGTDAYDIGLSFRQLIVCISQQQVDKWYREGENKPRNTYTTYPDYRIFPSNEYVVQPADIFTGSALRRLLSMFDDYVSKEPTNRWFFKVSGLITNNVLGRTFDGIYYQNASLVQTRVSEFGALVNGTTTSIPIENYPSYNPSHEYAAYFTQTVANQRLLGIVWNGLPIWNAVDCSGTLTIQRFDLGKVDSGNWLEWL